MLLNELVEALPDRWTCFVLNGDGVPLENDKGEVIEFSNYGSDDLVPLEPEDFLGKAVA